MDAIDRIFRGLDVRTAKHHPIICCLYTGIALPPSCAPMLRWPMPPTGILFGDNFQLTLEQAIAQNPAVHDGAVMVGRTYCNVSYRIIGWSFRLFPGPAPCDTEPNRGSAFNSCLAMSMVPRVDRIYIASLAAVLRFERGSVTHLSSSEGVRSP
jgi:hypothetical protein